MVAEPDDKPAMTGQLVAANTSLSEDDGLKVVDELPGEDVVIVECVSRGSGESREGFFCL